MEQPGSTLPRRQMLVFWLPLAASWLLMSAEVPVLQAAIARLADMETELAAFGIVTSLQIAIESPVIMLLATSTALTTSHRNYRTLRVFMAGINVLCTIVALLMAFTPLYDLVVRSWMGIPPDIAAAALPGMKIMILWAAAIGVRRFFQGVMIRQGQTRWVGYGTVVRLLSSGGTGILLALMTDLPGVSVGSIGLMAGVCSEAVFAVAAARPVVRRILRGAGTADPGALTLWEVTRYHTPLAATSLLTLMAQPVIGAGLARMPHPSENLAAWPVVWAILFIFRSPAFALPEAVIALISQGRPQREIRRFCRQVGMVSSAAMALLVLTPLAGMYLHSVAGLPEALSEFVVPGLLLSVPLPFISAVHSWLRGALMSARRTHVIYWGMGVNLLLMIGLMTLGGIIQGPGSQTAVVALTAAFLAELYYLFRKQSRSEPRA